jgi:hypothetical protein
MALDEKGQSKGFAFVEFNDTVMYSYTSNRRSGADNGSLAAYR